MNTSHRSARHWFLGVLLGLLASGLPAGAFYNPHTGRWLCRDPAGERMEQNLHAYVQNDPVASWDALGKRRAPNVDKFEYGGQPHTVTATVTVNGTELCNMGRIEFEVGFSYAGGDGDARYAERAFFVFDGQAVGASHSYDSVEKVDNVCGSYTRHLSTVCPTTRQSGLTSFDAWYDDQDRHPPEVVYVWGVMIYWQYKCNACCELEEPLSAAYFFGYGPSTTPIPDPSPRAGPAFAGGIGID